MDLSFSTDEYKTLLRDAYDLALNSPDTSTQNGGVAIGYNGKLVGSGCNTFTRGMEVTPDLLERPKKYSYIEHAERNVLFDVLSHGRGPIHTLVVPWAACCDCARAIVQSGVHTLVRHQRDLDAGAEDRWGGSIIDGDIILREGGVNVVTITGPLGGCSDILFSGEMWTP